MKWAFIYLGVGCNADVTHAELTYREGSRNVHVYGVGSLDEGCALAKRLVEEEGFSLLELCGGFGKDGYLKIAEAVDNKILVGYIDYLPDNAPMRALLPKDESRHMDWAFIFLNAACHPDDAYAKLSYRNGSRDIHLYGVASVEEACALSKVLVEEQGFPLLELCGGFHAAGCQKVIDATGGKALVGYVVYLPENESR